MKNAAREWRLLKPCLLGNLNTDFGTRRYNCFVVFYFKKLIFLLQPVPKIKDVIESEFGPLDPIIEVSAVKQVNYLN